jgi:hypothetical protein
MKTLTKMQAEAIADEVQERLTGLSTPDSVPQRIQKEWETLKVKLIKHAEMSDKVDQASDKIDEAKEVYKNNEAALERKVKEFESEMEERIQTLYKFEKVEGPSPNWDKMNEEVKKNDELKKEADRLEAEYDKLNDEFDEYDDMIKEKVKEFEKKHSVSVNYRFLDLDEGEEPNIVFPQKDYKDKILRQISILSIDKKGPLTADDLIEAIIKKMSVI